MLAGEGPVQEWPYSSPVLGGLRVEPAGPWPGFPVGWPPALPAPSGARAVGFGMSWHLGQGIVCSPAPVVMLGEKAGSAGGALKEGG